MPCWQSTTCINCNQSASSKALLFTSKIPLKYWNLAIKTAIYIYNYTPHTNLQFISPYEKLYNKKPDISNIRVWGSITYYSIKIQQTKLQPKLNLGILIGFNSINYLILNPNTNQIF